VPKRVQTLTITLSEHVKQLRLEDCERDQNLYLEYTACTRLAIVDLGEKWAWPSEPPYCFANILEPGWASVWISEYQSVPEGNHHRVTRHLQSKFGARIELLAGGGDASGDLLLAAEQKVWERMSLCSDPAEGYHRSVRLETKRASSAKLPFVFSTLRLKQNLDLARRWCSTPEGEKSFVYNFVNYSRILQTKQAFFLRAQKALGEGFDPKQDIYIGCRHLVQVFCFGLHPLRFSFVSNQFLKCVRAALHNLWYMVTRTQLGISLNTN
jgi:hypothetical protein